MGGGNVYSANASADLTMDKSAGSTFFIGDNYHISQKEPNTSSDPVQIPVLAFFYTYQDGGVGFTNGPIAGSIDPVQWDDGSGTLASVGNNQFTTQRIWFLPLINIAVIHYGQTQYGSMADAQAAINTEAFNKNPALVSGFRAWLILKKETTDLTDTDNALFVSAGKFGDVLRD